MHVDFGPWLCRGGGRVRVKKEMARVCECVQIARYSCVVPTCQGVSCAPLTADDAHCPRFEAEVGFCNPILPSCGDRSKSKAGRAAEC